MLQTWINIMNIKMRMVKGGGGYDRIKLYIITRVNSKSMANMTEKLKTKYMMWSQEDVEKDITGSYGYSW